MKRKDRVYWNKLLILLAEDTEWYLHTDTELYKKITALGKKIFGTGTHKISHRINKKDFLSMESEGIPYTQIAINMNVSVSALHRWKKVNRGK